VARLQLEIPHQLEAIEAHEDSHKREEFSVQYLL
jgi:hypothetical protein